MKLPIPSLIVVPRPGNGMKGTEGQRTARGTEDSGFPLFLWLLSVPLYPLAFPWMNR
jgi:hypothetical protein